jgi:hypothetical protein
MITSENKPVTRGNRKKAISKYIILYNDSIVDVVK